MTIFKVRRFVFIHVQTGLVAILLTLVGSAIAQAQSNSYPQIDDQLTVTPGDWPWWRGPQRNNFVLDQATYPTTWSSEENIKWKSEIPGRGHGSPIVVGKRVVVPTCLEDSGAQSVICYDRETGEQLWNTTVHKSGGLMKNEKSTAASSTLAFDGKLLFVNFPNSDAIHTSALDLEGNLIWQVQVSDYTVHQGYGASPTLYRDLVYVAADNKGGGLIAALNRETGDIVWKRERPAKPNYPSPVVVRIGDQDQLIMTGCDQVISYNPLTGETLWQAEGATTECVTSTVTDGKLVFSSGGYPRNHLAAYRADKDGEIAWETNDRVYVPSLLIKDGYLFGVMDNGIAACWSTEDGEVQWKSRLSGQFTSSPVMVGDKIYATNETGTTFIYTADPASFELLAQNELGSAVFATTAFSRGEFFYRAVVDSDGESKEFLYCISAQ